MNEFNTALIAEYRASGGRVTGRYAGADLLLLTTVGAKSGTTHTVPLTYRRDHSRYYVFASFAGHPHNPAWYHNLMAHPDVTIEVGLETIAVTASEITGTDRTDLYTRHAAVYPLFTDYSKKTDRTIPVIALTPLDEQPKPVGVTPG